MEVHHLAFRTASLEALARFYESTLGLVRLREAPGHSIWLGIGDAVLMIEQAAVGEPGIGKGTGELVAFRVAAEEREAVRERLARHSVALEAETEHTLYFRDPDGRRIGISCHPLVGTAVKSSA